MIDRTRHASRRCGPIRIACIGEPIRVSVCHCREWTARSDSPFATQVRFPAAEVRIEGEANATMWQYTGDSGHTAAACHPTSPGRIQRRDCRSFSLEGRRYKAKP
ncbi:hypothetical protein [Sphingopyxis sp. LK2115]|uniref:GFA family protein n=1 Tax=Sphingopyxis sp. LK2115 TaxID=2744558 RepID=UPI001CB6CEB5|nr:hypothetical protein [Sphingopyxis sp. LK2115]